MAEHTVINLRENIVQELTDSEKPKANIFLGQLVKSSTHLCCRSKRRRKATEAQKRQQYTKGMSKENGESGSPPQSAYEMPSSIEHKSSCISDEQPSHPSQYSETKNTSSKPSKALAAEDKLTMPSPNIEPSSGSNVKSPLADIVSQGNGATSSEEQLLDKNADVAVEVAVASPSCVNKAAGAVDVPQKAEATSVLLFPPGNLCRLAEGSIRHKYSGIGEGNNDEDERMPEFFGPSFCEGSKTFTPHFIGTQDVQHIVSSTSMLLDHMPYRLYHALHSINGSEDKYAVT